MILVLRSMSETRSQRRHALPVEWWEEEPASSPEEIRLRHAANKASWEQAAGAYARELDDALAFLRDGSSNLHPIERNMLDEHRGSLAEWCESAIHLQCASGKDTLSLLNEGVQRVVGVDIAERHIANARRLTEALDAPATWYCCDVLDTPSELDGTADLVYTGRGAIGWIHDLDSWASVVARLLKPGGVLSLLDDHPTSHLFDPDEEEIVYSGVSYFDAAAAGYGFSESYIAHLGVPMTEVVINHDRVWTIAEIFAAIRGTGLEVVHIGEHPEPYWDLFPLWSPDQVRRIPQTLSILAERPT